MKRANAARRAFRLERDFGAQGALCRTLPCSVVGCRRGPSDPAHVRTRGAGGRAKDCVPLCREHHREQGDHGEKAFDRKYGLDLPAIARRLAALVSAGAQAVLLVVLLVGCGALEARDEAARAHENGQHCGCPASPNGCSMPCVNCCTPMPCPPSPTHAACCGGPR